MTRLFLEKCSLKTAPSLQYILSNLEGLILNSNPIHTISHDYFNGCLRFRRLHCASCKLSSIPNLRPIAHLIKDLDLNENRIDFISNLYDVPFITLRFINLDQNNIKHIEANRLILPSLMTLKIKLNMLTSLEDVSHSDWGSLKVNPNGVTIYLSENPWHCDKRLNWLSVAVSQVPQDQLTLTVGDGPFVKCATPPSLRGRSVDTIGKPRTTPN